MIAQEEERDRKRDEHTLKKGPAKIHDSSVRTVRDRSLIVLLVFYSPSIELTFDRFLPVPSSPFLSCFCSWVM
jgi:hypothetical protein